MTDQPNADRHKPSDHDSYRDHESGADGSPPGPSYRNSPGSPIPLSPMSLLEQFSVAAALLRFNPTVFIIIPFATFLLTAVIPFAAKLATGEQLAFWYTLNETSLVVHASGSAPWWAIFVAASVATTAWLTIIIVNGVMASAYGRRQSASEAVAMGVRDLPRTLLPWLGFAALGLAALVGVPGLSRALVSSPGAALALALPLQVAVVILAVRLFMTIHVVIAEQERLGAALRASWERTRSAGWFVFGSFLVLALITVAIDLIATPIATVMVDSALYAFVDGAVYAILSAFTLVTTTVMYLNLRMRTEGFHGEIRESLD